MMAPDAAPFAWASAGEAARFLAVLDPADGFHFRTFSEPTKGNGAKYAGPLSEVFDTLERANANGHGVFVVVNEGGQDQTAITRVRAVFADMDDAPLDPVLACTLAPSLVVQSSPNRFHAYWLLSDALPLDEFKPVQKAIAARFGGDPVVCDLPRVMRLPGFHNRKGEPYPVAMRDDLSSGQRYSADAIRREFPPNVHHLPTAAGTATAGTPPAVAGPPPGPGSHATLPAIFDAASNAPALDIAAVGAALRHLDAGNSEQWRMVACSLRAFPEGWGLLDAWSQTAPAHYSEGRNRAAWSKLTPFDGGAAVLFAAAMKAGWTNTATAPAVAVPAARPLTFSRVGELLNEPPPEYLIDGWLVVDTLAGMIGRSGSGKSFCALTMALCIATGKDFFGCEVKAGSAFMLAGEGRAGLTRRAKAWATVNGAALDAVPLFIADRLPPLTENVGAIIAAIGTLLAEHGPPRLIVIDTLARAFNGEDENSAAAMSQFVAALDRMRAELQGVTVLIIHHTGHDGTRARGSSAYYAALDIEIMIERDKHDRVSMNNTKSKDAAPPDPMIFELEPVELDDGPASAALRLPHDPAAAVQEQWINQIILEPAAVGNGYKLSEREAVATLTGMNIEISRQAIGKRRRKHENETG
ncbi:AAA family ATPase [Luteimonas sp. A277]